jgi:2-C-methyl-D-erythritol 4-phosphate cytidylyltransferase
MKQSSIRYFVIVPAAGIGARMKSDIPKQYLSVKSKSILEHTLTTLLNYPLLKKCVVVIAEEDKHWSSLKFSHAKLMTALGGKERCHSVLSGLLALEPFASENDWILVHDAVRPFLQTTDIDKLITQIGNDPIGGLLGTPIKNTIKCVDEEQHVQKTLDRQKLWQALTPQLFRYHWLLKALHTAIEKQQTVTDEAQAIELLGQHPKLVEGRSDNIKITDSCDLALFDYYCSKK